MASAAVFLRGSHCTARSRSRSGAPDRDAGHRNQEQILRGRRLGVRAHHDDAMAGGDALGDMDVERVGEVEPFRHVINAGQLVHRSVDE